MGKRPGFRREKPLYNLIFEDHTLDGLEVMAKSLPLGEFLELERLRSDVGADAEDSEKLFRKLASVLVSWNLEDDEGKLVPCTYEGLLLQDLPFVVTILDAWAQAMAAVPKTSANGSNGSGTSLELSIPMEAP